MPEIPETDMKAARALTNPVQLPEDYAYLGAIEKAQVIVHGRDASAAL